MLETLEAVKPELAGLCNPIKCPTVACIALFVPSCSQPPCPPQHQPSQKGNPSECPAISASLRAKQILCSSNADIIEETDL
jgi:hypothetical protein